MIKRSVVTSNSNKGEVVAQAVNFDAKLLGKTRKFIRSLNENDRAKIAAAIRTLEFGDYQSVQTKSLRGPIKELIVRSYRIIFFTKDTTIYFVSAFRKKSRKTPSNEIKNAENILRMLDE